MIYQRCTAIERDSLDDDSRSIHRISHNYGDRGYYSAKHTKAHRKVYWLRRGHLGARIHLVQRPVFRDLHVDLDCCLSSKIHTRTQPPQPWIGAQITGSPHKEPWNCDVMISVIPDPALVPHFIVGRAGVFFSLVAHLTFKLPPWPAVPSLYASTCQQALDAELGKHHSRKMRARTTA